MNASDFIRALRQHGLTVTSTDVRNWVATGKIPPRRQPFGPEHVSAALRLFVRRGPVKRRRKRLRK